MSDSAAGRHLGSRLRALAERMEQRHPDADLARVIARALDAWEAALEGTVPGSGHRPVYHVWCDGSCAPNPGPGGWGAVIERDGQREEIAGASQASTNNIMELTAAIEALQRTPPGAEVHVTTDSRYLKDGITQWLAGWKRRGWRKADGEPVLNRALWEALDTLARARDVRWEWVRGHSGHPENERSDVLANQAREALVRHGPVGRGGSAGP